MAFEAKFKYGEPGWVCKMCAGDPAAKGHRNDCPSYVPFGGKPGRPRGSRSTDRKPRSAKGAGRFVAPLTRLMGTFGTMTYTAGMARRSVALAYDGQVIVAGAEPWAKAMQAWADENPSVARTLELVCSTSAATEVAVASLSIAVPIMAAHRIVPPEAAEIFGVERPPIVEVTPEEAAASWAEAPANGQGGAAHGEPFVPPPPDAEGSVAEGGTAPGGFGTGSVPPMV
ncbi:MAG: hypothetical protein LC798_05330 [Chloroflexi bacterium]|nr:hypothetical protein [Chloroflexota bacterium]